MPTNTHMKVIIIDLTVINKQATEFVIIKIICCFLLIGSLTLKKEFVECLAHYPKFLCFCLSTEQLLNVPLNWVHL